MTAWKDKSTHPVQFSLCGVAVVETNNNMKNLHLLITSKLSVLYEFGGQYHYHPISQKNFRSYHIYITSDEQIRQGDWYLTKHKEVYKSKVIGTDNNGFHFCKKIILTTDQDLIKDGVQGIGHSFLEWFVNNPTCDEVKIEKVDTFKKTNEVYVDEITGGNYYEIINQYKILIPQVQAKQETLEEAAERLYPFALGGIGNVEVDKKNHFIKGAKWQAKQETQNDMKPKEDNKQSSTQWTKNCDMGFEVGQEVFAFGGIGTIRAITDDLYPIKCTIGEQNKAFMKDGRYNYVDDAPSLFHKPQQYDISKPVYMPHEGETILAYNEHMGWLLCNFVKFHSGTMVKFPFEIRRIGHNKIHMSTLFCSKVAPYKGDLPK